MVPWHGFLKTESKNTVEVRQTWNKGLPETNTGLKYEADQKKEPGMFILVEVMY